MTLAQKSTCRQLNKIEDLNMNAHNYNHPKYIPDQEWYHSKWAENQHSAFSKIKSRMFVKDSTPHSTDTCTDVHCCFIHNSKEIEKAQCHSTHKCIMKMWYICKIELYSSVNNVMEFSGKWVQWKNTALYNPDPERWRSAALFQL